MSDKMPPLTAAIFVAITSGLRLERASMEEIYNKCVERGDTESAETFKQYIQNAIDAMNWIDQQEV